MDNQSPPSFTQYPSADPTEGPVIRGPFYAVYAWWVLTGSSCRKPGSRSPEVGLFDQYICKEGSGSRLERPDARSRFI